MEVWDDDHFFNLFRKVWNSPAYVQDEPEENMLINDDQTPLTVKVKLATEFVGSNFRVRWHPLNRAQSYKTFRRPTQLTEVS